MSEVSSGDVGSGDVGKAMELDIDCVKKLSLVTLIVGGICLFNVLFATFTTVVCAKCWMDMPLISFPLKMLTVSLSFFGVATSFALLLATEDLNVAFDAQMVVFFLTASASATMSRFTKHVAVIENKDQETEYVDSDYTKV